MMVGTTGVIFSLEAHALYVTQTQIDFLSILRALQVRPIPLQQQQNRLWDKTTTSA